MCAGGRLLLGVGDEVDYLCIYLSMYLSIYVSIDLSMCLLLGVGDEVDLVEVDVSQPPVPPARLACALKPLQPRSDALVGLLQHLMCTCIHVCACACIHTQTQPCSQTPLGCPRWPAPAPALGERGLRPTLSDKSKHSNRNTGKHTLTQRHRRRDADSGAHTH